MMKRNANNYSLNEQADVDSFGGFDRGLENLNIIRGLKKDIARRDAELQQLKFQLKRGYAFTPSDYGRLKRLQREVDEGENQKKIIKRGLTDDYNKRVAGSHSWFTFYAYTQSRIRCVGQCIEIRTN